MRHFVWRYTKVIDRLERKINEIFVQCNSNLYPFLLNLLVPETKIAEIANSVDLDDLAHDEPPHLDLHCLPSGLWILNMI